MNEKIQAKYMSVSRLSIDIDIQISKQFTILFVKDNHGISKSLQFEFI